MELLPVLTQNGKHKLLGSELQSLGLCLVNPNNVAKITPENIDLLYKINEKIEDKNYALELSDILNFENTAPEFADNYVKEANRFAKFGLEDVSANDLSKRINKRKAVSDFLEEYPIDVTTYDYKKRQNAKLSGSNVYKLSQYSNKAEVQKFVNSLTKETRTQFIECADFVDKGFPAEKFANLLNEAAKNDFGVIKGGMYDLIVKIMKTGSKDYDGMIDLIMAYKGTKCLDWYGNEQYVQVTNGDFKGAAKYIELAKVLGMNKEHFDYLIADKNADFKTVEACLTYVKENKIDLSSYSDYCLLRDNNWRENIGKIEYLKEQGFNNNLNSLHYYICTDLKSDISLKEFKEKFEFVNNLIKDNKDTDYRGLDTDYFKTKFANSFMKMGEVKKLQDLAKQANMKPAEVLELLVNVNKEIFVLAEKLCADKEFPKDKIAFILSITNKDNITLSEKLCADKDFPREYIIKILNYAKDKSNIENIESIMSNSTMKNWMIENLKNGLSVGNIYDLSRTQKMLINERKNAKAVQEKTSKVNKQQKVEVEKSNDILEAPKPLS